jgi:hypothetical protein
MVYRFTGLTSGGEMAEGAFKATKKFIRLNKLTRIGAGERVLIRLLESDGRWGERPKKIPKQKPTDDFR